MKTMTCRLLGGPCDHEIRAETPEEMVQKMTDHVLLKHPKTAEEFKKMHEEDPKKWGNEFQKKWVKTPDFDHS